LLKFSIITLRSISNIGARKGCKYLSTIINYSTSAANGARDLLNKIYIGIYVLPSLVLLHISLILSTVKIT